MVVGDALLSITYLIVNGGVRHTVRDTAAWLEATQTRVPAAAFAPVPLVTAPIDTPLSIHAYSTIMRSGAAPDDSVSRVFAEAIELLGTLGHNVVDGRLPFDGPDSIRVLNDITEGMFKIGRAHV